MFVTLIGLSGCGKSHLSRKLADTGAWQLIPCDTLIEQRLEPQLQSRSGGGTRRVAEWLGQPYDPGFQDRQQLYLLAEEAVVTDACAQIESAPTNRDLVVDATGSVIYLPPSLIARLRKVTTVVYLQVPEADSDQMFRQYLEDPKPVIWKNSFSVLPGETNWSALARSYRALLENRAALYERFAHKILHTSFAERATVTPERLLEVLKL